MSGKESLRSQIVKLSSKSSRALTNPKLREAFQASASTTSLTQKKGDSPRTILIVDDCLEDRQTVKRYLLQNSQERYAIFESELGEEVLEQYQVCKPDLVLVDYLLPDIDGLEVLEQLQQQAGKTCAPIILITGQGNETVAVRAMKAGACDYLVKGRITPEELQTAIAKAFERAYAQAEAEAEVKIEQYATELAITNEKLETALAQLEIAQEQLQQSERRFQRLVESNIFGITFGDFDGGIHYANDAFLNMIGYDREQLRSGRVRWDRLTPPEHLPLDYRAGEELKERGVCNAFEKEYIHKDGHRVPIFIGAALLGEPYEEQQEIVGFFLDLSKLKRTEQALRESEKRFRVSQELSLDGFMILQSLCDETGEIFDFEWIYANPKAGEIIGRRVEDLIGQRLLTVLPSARTESDIFDRYVRVVQTGQPHEIELFYDWDGITGWFRNIAVKLDDGVAVFFSDISDRKMSEIALRDSERRYATLARLSPVGIFKRDRKGRCIYVNERWCEMTGLEPEEALGMGWVNALHPDDRERVINEWQQALKANEPFHSEYRFLRPDGTTIWLLGQAHPETDSSGQILGYIGTVTDISDRKQIEAALYQSEERFRAFMNYSPASAWIVDEEGRFLYVNSTYYRMFRVPRQDVVGATLVELYPVELAEPCLEKNRQVLARQQVMETIETAPRPDGSMGEFLVYKFPMTNGFDQPLLGGIAIDITERRQAQAALAEQERRYHYIFESVGVSVWQEDFSPVKGEIERLKAAGVQDFRAYFAARPELVQQLIGMVRLVNVNEVTVRMFEAQNKEQLLSSLHQIFVPETTEIQIEQLATLATGETFCEGETVLQTLTGKRLTVLLTLTFPGGGQAYDCVLVTLVDISDRKETMLRLEEQARQLSQLNAALLQTTAELAKRNQELDRFAYIASHDLKAPLRAIANLSTWLEEDLSGQLNEDNQHNLELLRGRVDRMEALLDGLLAYSRIDRIPVESERTDVNEMLWEIIDALAPPPSFTIEIGSSMPIFVTKRLLLAQVFFHLISNAIKHRDRPDGRIQIFVYNCGQNYEFSVVDDGPGIAPEYHEKIFTIFQTLKARDVQENTGIGLTIVKKILDAQGGEIFVESELGRGSTFRFTWPLQ